MSVKQIPCLSLAIARLTAAGAANFAIWALESPAPGGYVHHDCIWSETLTQQWLAWQEMFWNQEKPHLPIINSKSPARVSPFTVGLPSSSEGIGGRLMQNFGISLWQWLFDGSIRESLAQSQGIAIGQDQPLRLRLEIRDPNLIPLPWEIMQSDAGKQAISLNPQILFSRTTSNVAPLPPQHPQEALKILLVLGEQSNTVSQSGEQLAIPVAQGIAPVSKRLRLESEAAIIARIITQSSTVENAFVSWVPAEVKTLIQPTTAKLSEVLDTGNYNVFFYAGHGIPAPDGGLIFLQSAQAINGTELAQILVRNQITLAVFNACWGAQSAQQGEKVLDRSSLAEVLIHHGVPAVLGMRDSIADQEAFSFIQAFTKALTQRSSIDLAVTLARQHLLTLYRFNQPAWTLPILYMHPEFNGELIQPINEGTTELPMTFLDLSSDPFPVAYIHSLDEVNQVWEIHGGSMRIGRGVLENDLIIQEKWVSTNHAAIFCRDTSSNSDGQYSYFLKDFSKFGTYIFYSNEWHKIHHQEVALHSGVKLKFGSQRGRVLEFVIDS